MMPQPSNEQMRVKARKRNGHGEANSSVEIEVEVEKQANNAHSPNVETSNSDMKKIKVEIVEENFFLVKLRLRKNLCEKRASMRFAYLVVWC